MNPESASIWYRRMSVVYAVGGWTVLGSLVYMGRRESSPGIEVKQKDMSTAETPEPSKGYYMESVYTHKENFVPLSQKILNSLKSWTGVSGPGS